MADRREGSLENSLPYNIAGRRRRPVHSDRSEAIPGELRLHRVSSNDAPELPPALMTVEELAVLLHTSKAAVYARLARGGIPGCVRLGRTLRFDPRVIAQWLSANSASAGGLP
jgi:excisionase family DNA binding protein